MTGVPQAASQLADHVATGAALAALVGGVGRRVIAGRLGGRGDDAGMASPARRQLGVVCSFFTALMATASRFRTGSGVVGAGFAQGFKKLPTTCPVDVGGHPSRHVGG